MKYDHLKYVVIKWIIAKKLSQRKLGWAVTSVTRVITSIMINVTENSKVIALVIFYIWEKADLGPDYFLSLMKVVI
jgi:hypothetical protein